MMDCLLVRYSRLFALCLLVSGTVLNLFVGKKGLLFALCLLVSDVNLCRMKKRAMGTNERIGGGWNAIKSKRFGR